MKHLALFSIVLYVIGIASSTPVVTWLTWRGSLWFHYALLYRKGKDRTSLVTGLLDAIADCSGLNNGQGKLPRAKSKDIDYNRQKNLKQ
jgi:hypothetical protein